MDEDRQFDGNDLQQWCTHFGFSEKTRDALLVDIGARCVFDLKYVYEDPDILKELEEKISKLQYLKFRKVEDLTLLLRKEKEIEASKKKKSKRKEAAAPSFPDPVPAPQHVAAPISPPVPVSLTVSAVVTSTSPMLGGVVTSVSASVSPAATLSAGSSEVSFSKPIPTSPIASSSIPNIPLAPAVAPISPAPIPVATISPPPTNPHHHSDPHHEELLKIIEDLKLQNIQLFTTITKKDEQIHSLEKKYQEIKDELKTYLDQNIHLSKDLRYEQKKATELFQNIKKLTKEKEMLDGLGNECMICRENLKNIVFMPCMHVSICKNCSIEHALTNCPQCRVEIKEAKVIYW